MTGVIFTEWTFDGNRYVAYQNNIYRYNRNIEKNISIWKCYKMKCKAKIMIKLAENKVVAQLKEHEHGPPTKVFDNGVCKVLGSKIIKGSSNTKGCARNQRIDQVTEATQPKEVAQTMDMQTTGVQTIKVQTVEPKTVKVQTVTTPTVEVEIAEVQTEKNQTRESEVRTMEVQNVKYKAKEVQAAEMSSQSLTKDMDLDLLTNVDQTVTIKTQPPPVVKTTEISTKAIPRMDFPKPAFLAESNLDLQSNEANLYFECAEGIRITGIAEASDNIKVGEVGQPKMYVNCKTPAKRGPATKIMEKTKCMKHSRACKNGLCKRKFEHTNFTLANDNVSLKNMDPKELSVAHPVSATQIMNTNLISTAQPMPTLAHSIPTLNQPINVITQNSKFINLYCVQTNHGPQIMALAQPLRSPKVTQPSTSSNVAQLPCIAAQLPLEKVVQQPPLLVDLTSSMVAQPSSIVFPHDSFNVEPHSPMVNQSSTSVVIVAKPKVEQPLKEAPLLVDQTFPTINQSSSHMDQSSTSKIVQVSSSKEVKSSPLLLTQLSSSMVSQFFTSLEEQPSTSKIDQKTASHVDQPSQFFVSLKEQSCSSKIDETSGSQVNQISQFFTSLEEQLSTSNIDISSVSLVDQQSNLFKSLEGKPSTSKVDPLCDSHVDKPSQFFASLEEQRSTLPIKQSSFLSADEPSQFFTSLDDQPSISKTSQSSDSHVDQPSPSVAPQPTTTKDLPLEITKTMIKKTKVAKRISRPRISKARAEILMQTYLSDNSDDD